MSFRLSRATMAGLVITVVSSVSFALAVSSFASAAVLGKSVATAVANQPAEARPSAVAPETRLLVGEYSGYNLPADIDAYTSVAGSRPDVVQWFQSWDEPLYYSNQRAGIDSRNVTPMITWSPGSNFTMANLMAGKYDPYLVAQARSAKAWTRPIMIRPFHEMNGDWMSYGPGRTSAAQFIAGWRHLVNLFRAEGVTNVSWVWSPNIYGFGHTVAFADWYPGDGYVDWVGLDGYNFEGTWRTFSALFTHSYADITKLTSRPLMLAEWGCNEADGSKAKWITDAFAQLPTAMPRIRMMVSFNRVAESDFRVNSSASSLAAYRSAISRLATAPASLP